MHIVHYSSDYSGIPEAVASGKNDALAVLGFMFEVCWEWCQGGGGGEGLWEILIPLLKNTEIWLHVCIPLEILFFKH